MSDAERQLSLFVKSGESQRESPGFSVRVSGRARRISIKVYPRGRVEVVAPKRASARDVERFVAEHRDWIAKTRAAFAAELEPESVAPPAVVELPSIGQSFRICYQHREERARVRQHGDVVVVRGDTDDEAACIDALTRWLKRLARQRFEPQLRSLSLVTGLPFRRLQVRAQRTCWGSHSSTGTITMNFSLLFLAPELVRYLMIHELCHARHMNHSGAYWNLVERFEPEYRELDRRLSASWRDIPAWLGLH